MTSMAPSVIQDWTGHFPPLAGTLLVKRDDLLPFALAGNKYRKLRAELQGVPTSTAIVTVGAATSNHCRTVAMMAAQSGRPAHLVLHASNGIGGAEALALRMIEDLGASYQIVDPSEISRWWRTCGRTPSRGLISWPVDVIRRAVSRPISMRRLRSGRSSRDLPRPDRPGLRNRRHPGRAGSRVPTPGLAHGRHRCIGCSLGGPGVCSGG